MIKARSLARRAGITRLLQKLTTSREYEDRFRKALEEAIQPGDTVWDVGANVGLYTEQFARRVGSGGAVIAFEPFPDSAARIRERVAEVPWAKVENCALGSTDTTGNFVLTDSSTTHHIATSSESADAASQSIPVTLSRGDTVRQRLEKTPQVIKIDVEGFELEVLKGLDETLASGDLRAVLVEVHFQQLEERGQPNAPVAIEKLLKAKGFKTKWIDSSHIAATRSKAA